MTSFTAEVLKAAFEDAETRQKLLDPDVSWCEMERIILEFAEKHGAVKVKVVQL